MFFGNLLELILVVVDVAYISHDSPSNTFLLAKVLALLIFLIPTFGFFPSTDRLLARDLEKDKDNLYAKAIMLQRKLVKRNKIVDKTKKDKDIEETIEKMEKELADDREPRHP